MADYQELYELPESIGETDVPDRPEWMPEAVTYYDVAAILQGGCDSGAYMPAVTYHRALETMTEHGDGVYDYIEDVAPGTLETIKADHASSWAGLACAILSTAVELWCSGVELPETADAE